MSHSTLTVLLFFGGTLYLLNKIFLDLMERRRGANEDAFWFWKKAAWWVYLAGLPFIVAYFFDQRNWIFGAIELGGAPAMLYGLVAAVNRRGAPRWLDWTALAAIPIGIALSVRDFGGITTITQWLEIGGSAGFLIGTYLLAKDKQSGYWWFLLMNVATGLLFAVQHRPVFVLQQAASVGFNLDAYRIRRANEEQERRENLSRIWWSIWRSGPDITKANVERLADGLDKESEG